MDTTPSLATAIADISAGAVAEAWPVVLAQAAAPVRALACRLTGDQDLAEDVLQETLLAVLAQAGLFQPRLEPDRDALRWILALAAVRALSLRRGQARRRHHEGRSGSERLPPVLERPDEHLAQSERQARLHGLLEDLSEPWRTALTLRYFDELGYDAIAAAMRIPVGTAKTHVHRGLERLRRLMPKDPEVWAWPAFLQPRPNPRRGEGHGAGSPGHPTAALGSSAAQLATVLLVGALVALSALVSASLAAADPAGGAPEFAATPPALPAPAPDPVRLTAVAVTRRWSIAPNTMPAMRAMYGDATRSAQLDVAVHLDWAAGPTVAGYRLTIADARTDTGQVLSCPHDIIGHGGDDHCLLALTIPQMGAKRLRLQGTLALDYADGPEQRLELDVSPHDQERCYTIAGHPTWMLVVVPQFMTLRIQRTPDLEQVSGPPVFRTPRGTPLSFHGQGAYASQVGSLATIATDYLVLNPQQVHITIPVQGRVRTVRIPVLLSDLPLQLPLPQDLPSDVAENLLQTARVSSVPGLTCLPSGDPAPEDPGHDPIPLRYGGFTAEAACIRTRRAVPFGIDVAIAQVGQSTGSDAAGELPWRGAASNGCSLDLIAAADPQATILALRGATVDTAVTDANEHLHALAEQWGNQIRILDAQDTGRNHVSLDCNLRLPTRDAQEISRITGTVSAIVATAAPLRLQGLAVRSHLGTWLAVPGKPQCAVRMSLRLEQDRQGPVSVLRIEKTRSMDLALRDLQVLRASTGQPVPTDGCGEGEGDGLTSVELIYRTLPDDAILSGRLYLEQRTVTLPFTFEHGEIAVERGLMYGETRDITSLLTHATPLTLRPAGAGAQQHASSPAVGSF